MKMNKIISGAYKNVNEMLLDGISSIHSTNDALTKIWRTLVYRKNWMPPQWSKGVDNYALKYYARTGNAGAAHIKSNLTTRLAEDNISFSQLLKGIEILGYNHVELTIRVSNNETGISDSMTVSIVDLITSAERNKSSVKTEKALLDIIKGR